MNTERMIAVLISFMILPGLFRSVIDRYTYATNIQKFMLIATVISSFSIFFAFVLRALNK